MPIGTRTAKAFERKAQSAKQLRIAITAVERLNACNKDTDELVCLIEQLLQTILAGHLVFRQQLQPEGTLLQFLKSDQQA
jgi:hypothetical protein